MKLFEILQFEWDRAKISVPSTHSREHVCFHLHRMLPEFVWDAGVLEGNPITFVEVKTLLEGVTIGGRKLSDQEQILNFAESTKLLLEQIKTQNFRFDRKNFCEFNAHVAKNESLEWGVFRGEGKETGYTPRVLLGEHGHHHPAPTTVGAGELIAHFEHAREALLNEVESPFERGLAFFLFGALQQFFFDGNKRTSRLLMNGILMDNGFNAISIHAKRAQEFNEEMVEFYRHKNADRMIAFLVNCYEE